MRRIKDKTLVPPGEWRYTHETGYTTRARTYQDWVSEAKEHRRANGLDIPLNFEAQLNDQLCGILPPEWCDRDPGDVSSWVDTSFNWADFTDGMKIFAQWGLQGMPLVEEEEANRRGAICVSCPLNVNVSGCAACHKMASVITGAVAQKKGAHDDHLRACAVCRCALRSMQWFPVDLLVKNDGPERQALRPDFCWAKVGSVNYIP